MNKFFLRILYNFLLINQFYKNYFLFKYNNKNIKISNSKEYNIKLLITIIVNKI